MPENKDELFEDAEVIYRNFAGQERQFNSAGDRNFCIILPPERADELEAKGWNVKTLKPREEGDEPRRMIKVNVKYDRGRPPRFVIITPKGRIDWDADMIPLLDFGDVQQWDIVVSPYSYDVNGNKGISAYLKHAFVTLAQNEFEEKYDLLPDLNPTQTPTNPTMDTTASEEVA